MLGNAKFCANRKIEDFSNLFSKKRISSFIFENQFFLNGYGTFNPDVALTMNIMDPMLLRLLRISPNRLVS